MAHKKGQEMGLNAIEKGILEKECENILKDFFKKLRKIKKNK